VQVGAVIVMVAPSWSHGVQLVIGAAGSLLGLLAVAAVPNVKAPRRRGQR